MRRIFFVAGFTSERLSRESAQVSRDVAQEVFRQYLECYTANIDGVDFGAQVQLQMELVNHGLELFVAAFIVSHADV